MNSRYLTDKAKYLVFFVAYTHTLLYMYYFMATANGLRIFRAYSSKYLFQSVSASKPYLLQPDPQ